MQKTILTVVLGLTVVMNSPLVTAKNKTDDHWTIMGLGNESCTRWTNAHTGKEPEVWKFALEAWYLGYLSAHSADKNINMDNVPFETILSPMNTGCKETPNAKIGDVAHVITNVIDKDLKK